MNENMEIGGLGSWFIILILFLLAGNGGMFGGNRGGFGGGYGYGMPFPVPEYATKSDVSDVIATQTIENSIANLNTGMNSNFSQALITMNQGFNGIAAGIANAGFTTQQCCCDMKSTLLSQAQSIKDLITANRMNDQEREIILARLSASQEIQTNVLKDYIDEKVTAAAPAATA